jgi:hypothetical protein
VGTLGDARTRGALAATAIATAAGVAWILYVDRNLSFFGDDWTLVISVRQDWPAMLLAPHNGHWILVHNAIYAVLFNTVGLRSYVPYLLPMLAAHAASVVLLFGLIRRRAGDLLAMGAAAILLLYGAAAEDLAWAFQVEFIAPVAFGLAALLLLDRTDAGRSQVGAAAVLLTLAVASSGMGLVMCVLVGAEVVLDPARRRYWPALLPPGLIYALWYLLVARSAAATPSLSPATLAMLPDFVRHGLAPATAAVFGLSARLSTLVLVATAGFVAAAWWRRGRVGSRAAGPLIALLAEFVLIGLTRAQFGIGQGASSRYMYIAAVLILLVLSDALAWLPARRLVMAPLLALVGVSVVLNAHQLAVFAASRSEFAARQMDVLRTFEAYHADPLITPDDAVDPTYTPITPRQYFDATSAWGSPVASTSTQDLGRLNPSSVDLGLVTLFTNGLTPGPAPPAPSSCAPVTDLTVEPGTTVLAIPEAGGIANLSVAVLAPPGAGPSTTLTSPESFHFGGDRLPGPWRVTITGGALCPIG